MKLEDNPPTLFVDPASKITDGRWWVAHTKSRMEKVFAWALLAKKIPYFLPMIERITLSGRNERHNMIPVFPSYVFFSGDESTCTQALMTNRLCQIIPVENPARLSAELTAIERALLGKADVEPHLSAVGGPRYRITQGPFTGLQGTITERGERHRLVLPVSAIGQGVSLEINMDSVELVVNTEKASPYRPESASLENPLSALLQSVLPA